MQTQLSLKSVVAVARAYRKLSSDPLYLAHKDLAALRKVERASANSLAVISRGGLAPAVRTPESKVRSMCWALLKAAKAELRERCAAEAAAHAAEMRASWFAFYGERDDANVDVRDAELGATRPEGAYGVLADCEFNQAYVECAYGVVGCYGDCSECAYDRQVEGECDDRFEYGLFI